MTNSRRYFVVLFLLQSLEWFFLCNWSHNALVWIVFPRLVLNYDQCICAKYACCSFLWLCPQPCSYSRQEFFWSCSSHPPFGNQLINFGNFTLQFKSILVVCCIFIFLFFFCCFLFLLFGFFFQCSRQWLWKRWCRQFVCSYGQSICFQWCPFDSGHSFIAFLLQQGIQFGVGVGIVRHHFPVLKLTHEWGIKS